MTTTYTWPLYVAPAAPLFTPEDEAVSAIEQARRDMLLLSAENSALTVVGQNYGVPRPPMLSSDDTYRRCVQVLARQPKMIAFITEALLAAIFGSRQALLSVGQRPWRVYEVHANEVIIEMPQALIARDNTNASYFHGWDGYAYNATGAASAVFTTEGDVQSCTAEDLNSGGSLSMNLYDPASGLWINDLLINSCGYDAATNTTTITLDDVYVPAGGTMFHIKVIGDDVDSYRGDYVAPSGYVASFATPAGSGVTDQIYMSGDYAGELYSGMTVTLIYGGTPYVHTVSTVPTYSSSTNQTAFQISATVPEGITNGVLVKVVERADVVAAAGHEDRVYFSGDGRYEVFDYYFNLLVRAAGIVVRIERI